MAYDTTDLLGRKQSAGSVVLPRGSALQGGVTGAGLAGVVAGEAIGAVARKKAKGQTSQTPQIGRSAYLAVTDTEVALLKVKRGAPGNLGEVLARVPRAEVTSAKLSPGMLRTNVTITFNGGAHWDFEQSPLIRPVLIKIIRALGY
jgi:hypothetical protein